MIGFSIMMFFLAIVMGIVAISLLRGKTASMHGKVYETTSDKTGYAKASGRVVMFMMSGMLLCGVVSLLMAPKEAIRYSTIILVIVIIISAGLFLRVQKKYQNK